MDVKRNDHVEPHDWVWLHRNPTIDGCSDSQNVATFTMAVAAAAATTTVFSFFFFWSDILERERERREKVMKGKWVRD
ncbi:hypothetical protein TIFTF001_002527 [Ficus carica]|uniref:Transmembrane protein n=1 Tax=Ficus carica TaxID=3494 RepID=A0AA88CTW7_FICCA|nr:hypothetical protein TIFTF001_002527 [Ficus carica]